MKDKEARQQIKRVESKIDKTGKRLETEIRAGQYKDDIERIRLIERIDDLWGRFLEIESAWFSKFQKVEAHWEVKGS